MPLPTQAAVDQEGFHGIEQQPPSAPRALETHSEPKGILLRWSDVGPTAAEYRIFRFDNANPDATLKVIAVVSRNKYTPLKITYLDTTAVVGVTYTYFITSNDQFGSQSQNSAMVTQRHGP